MAKKAAVETVEEDLSEEDLELLKSEGIDPDMPEEEETAPEADEEGSGEPNAEAGDGDQPEGEKASGDAKKAKNDFVPLATFLEERNQNKQYRETLNQIASKLAEQRASKEEKEPAPEQPPNREEDPLGYIAWQDKRLQKMEEFVNQSTQEKEQQQRLTQEQQQWQQFNAHMDQEYNRAVQTDPTVGQAFETAFNAYAKQMDVMGIPAGQKQQALAQYIQSFGVNWAQGPRRQGVSLGDYIKNVAAAVGWQPEQNGGANAAEEQIQRQKKAMGASKTLSKSGSGAKPDMDLKELANLSGEELEEALGKNPELFEKLLK